MPGETKYCIFPDKHSLTKNFTNWFYHWINKIIKTGKNKITISLSGGSTPKAFFESLAYQYEKAIPWERIHFFWTDERCVPPFDKESNFKMTYDSLLSHVPVPSDNIHRVLGEKNPYEEKARYTNEISNHVEIINGFPMFDLVLLGMGADGHTASIFPGQDAFLHTREWVEVSSHPESGQRRITLTGKVLNNAGTTAFLVAGKEKAEKISQIYSSSSQAKKYPAFHVKPLAGDLYWFLDEEAGRFISG